MQIDKRGHAKITFGIALTDKQQAALHKHLDAFLQRHIAGIGTGTPKNIVDAPASQAGPAGGAGGSAGAPSVAAR